MEIEVKEIIKLEDGKQTGKIVGVQERKDPFHYIDVIIQPDKAGFQIKVGYPAHLSADSRLGCLLQRFGAVLVVKEKVDPAVFLHDKECEFVTIGKKGKDGNDYANVVPESLKPKKE